MKFKWLVWFAGLFFFWHSAVVFGQKVDLKFSHKLHIEDVGAACTDCHTAADSSTSPTQNLLPNMESCYQCHDEDSECTLCHKDPDNAIDYPRITTYIAKFPHATHIQSSIECTTCHENVAASENILDQHLPHMQKCTSCHTDKEKIDYCYTCHSQNRDLRPANHKLDWLKGHGIASQTMKQDCKSCHTEEKCLTCHQQDNLDRTVHPLNFVNNHSLVAKGNIENCYTCHEEQSFCVDCHRTELVMPRSHASAGWSNTKTGGGHARAARLDLDSCLSCHNVSDSEPVCLQCHQQ